jgi:hypothetical protein
MDLHKRYTQYAVMDDAGVVLDERDGRKWFDVFFKGGFVSGSPEEIITTIEQMAEGFAGIKEELNDWLQNPSQSKSALRR